MIPKVRNCGINPDGVWLTKEGSGGGPEKGGPKWGHGSLCQDTLNSKRLTGLVNISNINISITAVCSTNKPINSCPDGINCVSAGDKCSNGGECAAGTCGTRPPRTYVPGHPPFQPCVYSPTGVKNAKTVWGVCLDSPGDVATADACKNNDVCAWGSSPIVTCPDPKQKCIQVNTASGCSGLCQQGGY